MKRKNPSEAAYCAEEKEHDIKQKNYYKNIKIYLQNVQQ